MIAYIPFLKFKTGEVIAISELKADVRSAICPFFDYPKKTGGFSADQFKASVFKTVRGIAKHLSDLPEFYFDNYDVADTLTIDGDHNYQYLLQHLVAWPVIPVVGVDRSPDRLNAVATLKDNGVIKSNHVAFRLTAEDFEKFAVIEDDIENDLKPIFARFEAVDLVFDCRICGNADADKTSKAILDFSKKFCSKYQVRRVVVTGSSIPASISGVLKVKTECLLPRAELVIFGNVAEKHGHADLVFGDYTTVSPDYSDVSIPPEMMQIMMAPKFTYTLQDHHYLIRGAGLKANGYHQYFAMAKSLCSKKFFRGAAYSFGDAYLDQKSRKLGSNCTPAAAIKPTVNAHISYMVLSGPTRVHRTMSV